MMHFPPKCSLLSIQMRLITSLAYVLLPGHSVYTRTCTPIALALHASTMVQLSEEEPFNSSTQRPSISMNPHTCAQESYAVAVSNCLEALKAYSTAMFQESYAVVVSNCSMVSRSSSSLFRTGSLLALPCAASSRCIPPRHVSSRPGRTASVPRGRFTFAESWKPSSKVFLSSACLQSHHTAGLISRVD